MMGDLQQPGPEGSPLRIEGLRPPPDRQEDVLDDLFRGGAVQRLSDQVEDQRGVAAVERPERLLLPGGELRHQLLVAGILGRRHPADHSHLRLPHPGPVYAIWLSTTTGPHLFGTKVTCRLLSTPPW